MMQLSITLTYNAEGEKEHARLIDIFGKGSVAILPDRFKAFWNDKNENDAAFALTRWTAHKDIYIEVALTRMQ